MSVNIVHPGKKKPLQYARKRELFVHIASKTLFITLLVLLLQSKVSSGQSARSFIGHWKVNEVFIQKDSIPPDQQGLLPDLTRAFGASTFAILEPDKFIFDIMYEDLGIEDGRWTFDSVNQIFSVTERDDPESLLMLLKVTLSPESETFFEILETPIKLKVSKF